MYILSNMETAQRQEVEQAIQNEVPIYSLFDDEQKKFCVALAKKYGKEHIYLDHEGNWIDLRNVLLEISAREGFNFIVDFLRI